jgi:hypothetical protein
MPEDLAEEIRRPVRFTRRPDAIAPDFRPDWKISVLLLILQLSSRGAKSSLARLHTINWAIRTGRHQEDFFATRDSDTPLFGFKVRFEPAFSRAIDLAAAAGLVEWLGGDRVQLTASGKRIAILLEDNSHSLRPEVAFLKRIGKGLTETEAMNLVKGADIA